ncbi:MAG: hypothetical protein GWP10_19535 [Nitrospiraceae bacterium]|nr:hypothetical protein [Nitrospiraceae bacterium]
MTDVDRIKAAIDLRSLISESCKLDSNGRGGHENKHESKSGACLYVADDWWHCHHCQAGGDVFNWIADRDGLDIHTDFKQVLEIAAEIAGIPLTGSEVDVAAEWEKQMVFAVLKAAAAHFNENLTDAHRADITARWGITDETIDKLLIGIARNDEALEVYLKQQGFLLSQDCSSIGATCLSHTSRGGMCFRTGKTARCGT